MMPQPPQFESKNNCTKCNVQFGILKRKHHCRNCGKTYCNECSSKSLPIPQFGFVEPVRVCEICYELITSQVSPKAKGQPNNSAQDGMTVDKREPKKSTTTETQKETFQSETKTKRCVCNMPLCICPPNPAENRVVAPSATSATSHPTSSSDTSGSISSGFTSVNKSSTQKTSSSSSVFTGFGSVSSVKYDLKGDLNEQCRDAIKSGDGPGVTQLLKAGASAQYVDRTGNTLVHLAAMFNRIDLVQLLVKHGADVNTKNPAGETAIDLAPPALQHKMRQPNFAKE